ncbi:hypothetical protein GCM10022420_013310 [Streptomyces iranensis]
MRLDRRALPDLLRDSSGQFPTPAAYVQDTAVDSGETAHKSDFLATLQPTGEVHPPVAGYLTWSSISVRNPVQRPQRGVFTNFGEGQPPGRNRPCFCHEISTSMITFSKFGCQRVRAG